MRALALGLLLTSCIDWDMERRAALCLKDESAMRAQVEQEAVPRQAAEAAEAAAP